MDRDQRLREIKGRVEHDKPVWLMGSAEASFEGRFNTWSAMHCSEAGQVYEDREELLRIVEQLEAEYKTREAEIDDMIDEAREDR